MFILNRTNAETTSSKIDRQSTTRQSNEQRGPQSAYERGKSERNLDLEQAWYGDADINSSGDASYICIHHALSLSLSLSVCVCVCVYVSDTC